MVRGPININTVGTQTTQISIIHQLHTGNRGHIWGRIHLLSKGAQRGILISRNWGRALLTNMCESGILQAPNV